MFWFLNRRNYYHLATMENVNQDHPVVPANLGYIPEQTEEEYMKDVYWGKGDNEYWYTMYRCGGCLRFHHPKSYEDQDTEGNLFNLSCTDCSLKKELKAHKDWLRGWHQETSREVEKVSWQGKKFMG